MSECKPNCTCECHDYEDIEYYACTCPKLGEPVVDFEAQTTHGNIKFSEFNKDSWVVLFSHPADFTPVCTTEFLGFAQKQDEFEKRNVKLIGLSIDSVFSHIAWVRQIEKMFEVKIKFPVIADISMDIARSFGMVHPALSSTQAVRSVFIINPEGILKAMITYPMSLGRNIDEIIRMIDALQLAEKEKGIATPANWKVGDSVVLSPPTTCQAAEERSHEECESCHDWFLCKRKV